MNRKTLGGILLVLGVVLAIAGVVLKAVIVPGMKQFPDDVDTVRNYSGTMPVLFDANSFSFMSNLDVTIARHVTTEQTDGSTALVREDQTLLVGDQPVQQLVKRYAIDRKSMEAVDSYPDAWNGQDGLWTRAGLVIGWPIDSEQKDYQGWSDDYRATVPLVFSEEVTHPRSNMDTYLYTAGSGPQAIVPEAVEAMGLPLGLPKDQFTGLIEQTDLSPMVKGMLPTLLQRVEGDTVPLQYYYEYEAKYWIEPQTGVLIDTEKHELRKVGLSEDLIASSPLAALPAEQREALRVPVFDLTYMATDQSVQDAKNDAQDAIDQLNLYGSRLPYAAIVIGVVLAALGVVLIFQKRPEGR